MVPRVTEAQLGISSPSVGGLVKKSATTESLVLTCRGGDEVAWATLVRRFGPLVSAIARSYGLSQADCEDVSQATWLRLWRRLDQLRQPERLAEWLSMVARREVLRHLGGRRLPAPTDEVVVLERGQRSAASAEEEVLSREGAERLRQAFQLLSPRCQHMLALLMDEFSYAQVAQSLGLAPGSVGPVRSRCLNDLRRALNQVDAGRMTTADEQVPACVSGADERTSARLGGRELTRASASPAATDIRKRRHPSEADCPRFGLPAPGVGNSTAGAGRRLVAEPPRRGAL
ncbi:RNA polymerase sigma factor [Micromonospora sp. NPDC005203]|uniref:RNA polymerase sigma factor n=1 Tax=Micromonospora sp. NPDC005203 TaxID=3364226 RepID=UPI0036CFA3A6